MFRVNHRQVLLSLRSSPIKLRPYSSKSLLNTNQSDPQLDFQVDPDLEVGAIVRRVSETNAKAPLFHNVKGARDGLWKIYGRIARSLGLPPDSSWKDILTKMRLATHRDPLPPNILSTGPCKQNKIFGDDVDLTSLPVPLLHQGDGGKYLQTWGVHVLETPDKSWTNWSIFRGMVHDKRGLTCLVIPGQHNSMIRDQWLKQGKDEVPWALSLGAPPAASIAASIPLPPGVSEGDYVSALAEKPLDMVKCELSDLLGEAGNQPLFTVDAITYRDDAILPVSVPGRLTDESHTTASMASVQLLEALQEHNLPIKDAVAPLETLATWCVLQFDNGKLAEMKTNPDELCTNIGNIAFKSKATRLINRILLIGDDVDIHNWTDVIWAYTSRCRPGIDEYVFDEVMGLPLTPYRKYGRGSSVKGESLGVWIFGLRIP
ncbi:hypothetical protein EDB81DRAFT_863878 [Dactylonectria macrodidyma]|uniref:Phenacrylate decarboxylase n=1 Tax=Dactylonectria macrodidyma TaxID=307937 RepID=A0A9P9JR80_9HYPO|nr:hypothetical protein EDB81DRAFT_863878 [Dactylonectria macrodidyma]